MEHEALTNTIIGSGMKVRRILGPGFLESVYKNALVLELRARGLHVDREIRFQVHYEGTVVGQFSADIFVEGCVLVESKAVRALTPKHETQLVNHLTATGVDIGLLIYFGADRLEVRRKSRTYRPPQPKNIIRPPAKEPTGENRTSAMKGDGTHSTRFPIAS